MSRKSLVNGIGVMACILVLAPVLVHLGEYIDAFDRICGESSLYSLVLAVVFLGLFGGIFAGMIYTLAEYCIITRPARAAQTGRLKLVNDEVPSPIVSQVGEPIEVGNVSLVLDISLTLNRDDILTAVQNASGKVSFASIPIRVEVKRSEPVYRPSNLGL